MFGEDKIEQGDERTAFDPFMQVIYSFIKSINSILLLDSTRHPYELQKKP